MSQRDTIVNSANLSMSDCSTVSIFHEYVHLALMNLRIKQYGHRTIDVTTSTRAARGNLKLTPQIIDWEHRAKQSTVSIFHGCLQLALMKLRIKHYGHRMIDVTTSTSVTTEKLKLTPQIIDRGHRLGSSRYLNFSRNVTNSNTATWQLIRVSHSVCT
jgi:hypothetical protein